MRSTGLSTAKASHAQYRIYLHDLLICSRMNEFNGAASSISPSSTASTSASTTYNMPSSYSLLSYEHENERINNNVNMNMNSELDIDVLEKCFIHLMQRHSALRTRYSMNEGEGGDEQDQEQEQEKEGEEEEINSMYSSIPLFQSVLPIEDIEFNIPLKEFNFNERIQLIQEFNTFSQYRFQWNSMRKGKIVVQLLALKKKENNNQEKEKDQNTSFIHTSNSTSSPTLVNISSNYSEFYLCMNYHHISMDGFSVPILLSDLCTLYQSFSSSSSSSSSSSTSLSVSCLPLPLYHIRILIIVYLNMNYFQRMN